MNTNETKKGCLTSWVIIGVFLVAGCLLGVTGLFVWAGRAEQSPVGPATAVITVVSAPTSTPIPPTSSPTQAATATSNVEIPPSPPPGVITAGAYVQISGTGGDGLRMRADPNLQSSVLFIAMEAEVFQVTGGPQEADNYTWWYLEAPVDESRKGWVVSNYLQVVQNP